MRMACFSSAKKKVSKIFVNAEPPVAGVAEQGGWPRGAAAVEEPGAAEQGGWPRGAAAVEEPGAAGRGGWELRAVGD